MFITVPAFAQYVNVPDKTMRKWIRAGVLPAYRFVTEWRIAKTDAVAFVEQEGLAVTKGPAVTPDAKTSGH